MKFLSIIGSIISGLFSKSTTQKAAEAQAVKIIENPKKYNQPVDLVLMSGFNKWTYVLALFILLSQWVAHLVYPPASVRFDAAWSSIPWWQADAIKAYCLTILYIKPLNGIVGAVADGLRAFKK